MVTTAVTVEWGLTELANHPEMMEKIRLEAQRVVGVPMRVDHIDRLPYLNAFVKENFRMHPHLPLLLPHVNEEPAEHGGFHIPAKSLLVINAYAIARDPKVWPDPEKFEPESMEVSGGCGRLGQDCRLLPFGAGRRSSPGYPMAIRQVHHLIIGRFVQQYRLVVPYGKDKTDMREEFMTGVRNVEPLRLSLHRND